MAQDPRTYASPQGTGRAFPQGRSLAPAAPQGPAPGFPQGAMPYSSPSASGQSSPQGGASGSVVPGGAAGGAYPGPGGTYGAGPAPDGSGAGMGPGFGFGAGQGMGMGPGGGGFGSGTGAASGVPAAVFGPEAGFAQNTGGVAGGAAAPPGIIGDIAPTVAIPGLPASAAAVSGIPTQTAAIAGLPQVPPLPPPTAPNSPSVPSTKLRSQLAPSVRGFKIADNQSPFPQDRVYFSFNYFNDVNGKINHYFQAPISQLSVYRYIFGYEKTYNDGRGSIGIRLPLDRVNAVTSPGLVNTGGHSTGLGNLTIYTKYILNYNPKTGNLFTVGLAVTPPTGPGVFAGAHNFLGGVANKTTIQPFLGYYLNLTDRLFLQGFSALDTPTNNADVTLIYNDLALGYYLYRDREAEGITAVVPTLEAHVNTPLNHQNPYSLSDPAGTATSVNITSGLNFEYKRNSLFTIGVVTPTTGPRPFNVEAVALFNYRFGAPRRAQRVTPVIGG